MTEDDKFAAEPSHATAFALADLWHAITDLMHANLSQDDIHGLRIAHAGLSAVLSRHERRVK